MIRENKCLLLITHYNTYIRRIIRDSPGRSRGLAVDDESAAEAAAAVAHVGGGTPSAIIVFDVSIVRVMIFVKNDLFEI